MIEEAQSTVTDVASSPPAAEPTPPWVASTEAVVVDVPSATKAEGEQQAPVQEQSEASAAEPEVVTLKRDEYRRLMGTVGGLSSLQQQFQGIKAENAELRRQLSELQQYRQRWSEQEQTAAMQSSLQQAIYELREKIASQLALSDDEFSSSIEPVLKPVVQRLLELEKQYHDLERSYSQAKEAQARLAGEQWLQQASSVAIDAVQREFQAIGVSLSLTANDLRAVGATVDVVRDIDHLKQFAREAAFRKLQSGSAQQASPPSSASPATSLAAATGLPNGPWGLTPSGPSSGALSPRMLRQQYAAGKITFEQFRQGMANAPKEERDLLPSLFR